MRYKIENFEDITDVKDMMNGYLYSCSFKFLKYIMYIIVVFIVSIVIWSLNAEKSVVIKAYGEIDINNNVCNIYIESTVIGQIKENSPVQIEVVSLPKNDYGLIDSQISNISNDIIVDQNSNKRYYLASCKFNKKKMVSKDGENVKIRNGMDANIGIIAYKTTYFKYYLSMII